jgi:hypothetical protein
MIAFGIVHQRLFTCQAYHLYILPPHTPNGSKW